MFWRFGGYASISTIESVLNKEHVQLEDLLDESDLLQELKGHNSKLVEYLRSPPVLEKLLAYVVAPRLAPVASRDPDPESDDDEKGKDVVLNFAGSVAADKASEDEIEKKRNRYAFIAAEVLSSENWSICEALMESRDLLRNFWQFVKRPTPLDPLQASYFTKVNESLFDRKTEDMLDLLKSLEGAIPDLLKHVDCPMIMDLLLRIISLERTESGHGVVEWLYTQDLIPILLSFLGPEHNWATQTSAGDFIKAIITVSANASQNEQTCIGPNELTRQLVSKPCVEQLIKYMLGGGNPLTCGVGIVIEVIRKNNSDYDPDGVESGSAPSSRDPIYLGTLLRMFADHVPDFMNLIMNAPSQKERISSTFGGSIEPLRFDRFKTCELMAELLHCSNMGLLNEVGSEEFIASRDLARQRLRVEGRLVPARGGDASSAGPHSSPEGVRKLAIINSSADDDGFEEVTHAADDDSSGVEELPEVPPASSFLDKDEDDFVDEPLSSPRLRVRELDEVDDKSFEDQDSFEASAGSLQDQDLIVAPLSPTKPKAVSSPEVAEKGPSADTADKESSSDTTALPLHDLSIDERLQTDTEKVADGEKEASKDEASAGDAAISSTDTPTSEPTEPASLTVETVAAPVIEAFSPHPEDTPAPLFSSGNNTPTASSALPAETPKDPCPTPVSAEPESLSEPIDASVIINPTGDLTASTTQLSEATTPIDDGSALAPKLVVGDYLKMQFVEHRVVPTILSFFFSYPWNNFLHNVVYDIVQQVFNGPMDRGFNPTLAVSLFESADITNKIIRGQQASEQSQAATKTRMGYMGHLTLIAEEVVKFTERNPPELLSETVLEKVMAPDWISYVEGALAETRERDNAILGGVRPDVAHANRTVASAAGAGLAGIGLGGQGPSSALAEAGLNGGQDVSDGGGGSGIGPFAISAGTLMSGFGSSSDEDDDDEQDNEEDVNNEFRAYTDPLNASNSNSMNPPSIPPPPPPPPPLNTPPSRARLQLAARLAMNKRNAAAAAAAAANGSQEEGGAPEAPANPPTERLRNPFADDEDDEDDDLSGSDDGDVDLPSGASGSGGGSEWPRQSWWRGMVRGAGRGRGGSDKEATSRYKERFGDGRDDDSSGDDEDDEDMDDEEFGDFAMPEAAPAPPPPGGMVSGIDPAREKILLKPTPMHPGAGHGLGPKLNTSPFTSLWPFSTQSFGAKNMTPTGAERRDDVDDIDDKTPTATPTEHHSMDDLIPIKLEEGQEEPDVRGEDGNKIDRAVEAKSRTSIEDPDDDGEVLVGRPGVSGAEAEAVSGAGSGVATS